MRPARLALIPLTLLVAALPAVAEEPHVPAPAAPAAQAADKADGRASDSELPTVLQGVETTYSDVGAMTAAFVQTTRSSVFGDETMSGELAVKRPAKMRWSFEGEGGKEFVTDGETMWIWTKADNQVIQYDDVAQSASAADSLLQSMDKLSEMFDVQMVDDGDASIHTLDLAPKDGEDAQFKELRLILDDDYVMQKVRITDSFDNVTELEFSEVNLKADVDDATFTFEVPEGAEVVKAGVQ